MGRSCTWSEPQMLVLITLRIAPCSHLQLRRGVLSRAGAAGDAFYLGTTDGLALALLTLGRDRRGHGVELELGERNALHLETMAVRGGGSH